MDALLRIAGHAVPEGRAGTSSSPVTSSSFYADFHHVGLYIGGGQMIHAPRTGDVVKISPAWRTEFQFGVRPG